MGAFLTFNKATNPSHSHSVVFGRVEQSEVELPRIAARVLGRIRGGGEHPLLDDVERRVNGVKELQVLVDATLVFARSAPQIEWVVLKINFCMSTVI